MKIVSITPKSEYIIWEIGKYSKDKVANNTHMLICDRFNLSGSHHQVWRDCDLRIFADKKSFLVCDFGEIQQFTQKIIKYTFYFE